MSDGRLLARLVVVLLFVDFLALLIELLMQVLALVRVNVPSSLYVCSRSRMSRRSVRRSCASSCVSSPDFTPCTIRPVWFAWRWFTPGSRTAAGGRSCPSCFWR